MELDQLCKTTLIVRKTQENTMFGVATFAIIAEAIGRLENRAQTPAMADIGPDSPGAGNPPQASGSPAMGPGSAEKSTNDLSRRQGAARKG